MVDDVHHERPCFVVVSEGRAVSLCTTVRRSDVAAEAGVETVETHRRRAYAVEPTRAGASALHEEDLIPLYSTFWENTASRRVAEKLGAVHYASDYRLSP